MTKAAFRQSDVTRFYTGAIKALRAANIPVENFKLTMIDGQPVLLPSAPGAVLSEADDMERRMQEAFGK